MKQLALKILQVVTRPVRRWGLSRFYPFSLGKLVYQHLVGRLRPEFLMIHGNRLYLDPIDSLGLVPHKGSYEESTTEILKRTVQKGDVVLDIGASLGYFTLLAATLVGENGKIFSFEPNPISLLYLRKSVSASPYKNIDVIPKAVSDASHASMPFYPSDATSNFYRRLGTSPVEVGTVALDEFFGKKAVVDVIKLDVEGSEAAATRGMENILKNNKKVKLIVEFGPSNFRLAGEDPLAYLKTLVDLGFVLYNVDRGMEVIAPREISEPIDAWTRKHGVKNIFCARR